METGLQIATVGVIGAGTMGSGIAQVFARAGYTVLLRDVEENLVRRALDRIAGNLDRDLSKARISADERRQTLERIRPSTEITALRDAELVVEAVPEIVELKRSLLKEVDGVLRPEAIMASNTSSISITLLAASTQRADRFIGMHFMNPPPVMQLVEVIRGLATSDATQETILAVCKKVGKMPVAVSDSPGFVSNRVLMPLINEAVFCVLEGVATAESVDTVIRLGMNHPMGPLQLADLIGLDVCLEILEVLHRDLGDPKFRPCPLLRKMVAAGRLGRKSGAGFYVYDGAGKSGR
jgi:3-hydroxybutyryl-CoA dehydrogenase